MGAALGAQGESTRGIELAQAALAIAEEIEHRQWITASHRTLGAIYLDLFEFPKAVLHLEHARSIAREIGSLHWIRNTTAALAYVRILQDDLDQAQVLLDQTCDFDTSMQSVGQRLGWQSRAELALARGDAKGALEIADKLIASAAYPNHTPTLIGMRGNVVPRLWKLRGDALTALADPEAESLLLAARDAASEQGALPLLWRINLSLGRLDPSHYDAAREIIEVLARKMTSGVLRENFVTHATAKIPSARSLSPRQIAKKAYGGLTPREREVVGMIAQGKSNREIAESLVVSERTIETHVGNVLTKLGFGSRAQIAVWAVEKGLR